MPICYKRKLAFVHIPKNAGTSVSLFFNFKRDIKHLNDLWIEKSINLTHLTAKEMCEIVDLDEFYKFAFIRNPWDRMVSLFFYYKERPFGFFGRKDMPLDFVGFLSMIEKDYGLITEKKPNHAMCCHFLGQYDFIKDQKIDFIGRYENLNHDMKILAEKYAIHGDLPKVNQTTHVRYAAYYDSKSSDIVRSIYKNDVVTFGYHFSDKLSILL